MDYPFTTDGCSMWPDGNYGGCCVEHDDAYWQGGTWRERREADRKLMACVVLKGHPFLALLIYLGVRIGGIGLLPTPWRWGYGWKWPRTDDPLRNQQAP